MYFHLFYYGFAEHNGRQDGEHYPLILVLLNDSCRYAYEVIASKFSLMGFIEPMFNFDLK